MHASYEIKDKSISPPGGYVFRQKTGILFEAPYIGTTVDQCRHHHDLSESDAWQKVLHETYQNIPAAAREYFIVKNTEPLAIQNPTFRYVDKNRLLPAPYLYNPGLITIDGDDWLIYRRQSKEGDSTIAGLNLNSGKNQIINIPAIYENEQFEDPRVFWHDGNIHLCFSSWRKSWNYKPIMRLVKLDNNWNFKEEIKLDFGGNGQGVIQKNWQFFSHENELHFVYWYSPFQVVKGKDVFTHDKPALHWPYGELRGGTPPVLVDGLYYTFFHSRTESGRAKYYMGCLAFEGKTPFKPVKMTHAPLLAATNLEPSLSWAPLTVFPCGALYKDGKWCVSLGVNDLNCGLVDYCRKDLLSRMEDI